MALQLLALSRRANGSQHNFFVGFFLSPEELLWCSTQRRIRSVPTEALLLPQRGRVLSGFVKLQLLYALNFGSLIKFIHYKRKLKEVPASSCYSHVFTNTRVVYVQKRLVFYRSSGCLCNSNQVHCSCLSWYLSKCSCHCERLALKNYLKFKFTCLHNFVYI